MWDSEADSGRVRFLSALLVWVQVFVSGLVLMLVCSYFDRTHHQVLYFW